MWAELNAIIIIVRIVYMATGSTASSTADEAKDQDESEKQTVKDEVVRILKEVLRSHHDKLGDVLQGSLSDLLARCGERI